MWKRAVLLTLCFLLVCTTVVYASESRMSAIPTLTFSGRTATCVCNVSDAGKTLQVTMELSEGSSIIDSWYKTGTSKVMMNETSSVTRGHTYTLSVSVMINGISYGPYSITKTCPLL